MKNQLFLILVIIFYCAFFFSCKEKSDTDKYKNLFQQNSVTLLPDDSIQIQSEFSIELNVNSDPDQGSWQSPDLVIEKLGDLSGKIVADIGSGTGYFTFPISRVAKKVLAIDIEQRYLDYIEDRKLELPIEEADVIETRLTVEDEPNLHTDEVDAILMVNVFYYLNNRSTYMKIVNNALRENGILVLVDFKPGDLPVGPSGDKVPTEEVVDNLKSAGFSNVKLDLESLQYQYIITAK
ncbi:MAG: class I SAM-dependent methyltransferase [Cyclobacteriaceae bacterium]|nr:class I SAM-dependent methyltransferase [Cyclobacteriaceae bacterium]